MSDTAITEVAGSLDEVRRAYGASMRALTSSGAYEEGDGWWVGVTGAPDPDYNLALVYGGDVTDHAERVYEVLAAAGSPAIVLLAGRGLGAAQVLADHGWVCAGALDLTYLVAREGTPGPGFRPLDEPEMRVARALAADTFGISAGTAAVAYADSMPGTSGVEVVGVFDDGDLQCCTLLVDSGDIRTVWSLGTRNGRQRRGYAARLISGGAAHTYTQRGPVPMCGLTSPRITPLYVAAGAQVAESWQMWSRPRWLLGT